MKVIIAGSRDITQLKPVANAIRSFLSISKITECVCGEARGVDTSGRRIAEAMGIPVIPFPADWKKYGKPAGYLRNKQMGEYADAAIIVWDGVSTGTKHMIDIMQELEKPVIIYFYVPPKVEYKLPIGA